MRAREARRAGVEMGLKIAVVLGRQRGEIRALWRKLHAAQAKILELREKVWQAGRDVEAARHAHRKLLATAARRIGMMDYRSYTTGDLEDWLLSELEGRE